MYPTETAHISNKVIDLLLLDVKVITISKLSSEIIDRNQISLTKDDDIQELRDIICEKYPALYLSNDYKIFWQYSKNYFIEIYDTITYSAAIKSMASETFFILIDDFEEVWEDNLTFLMDLDRVEEEERKERERDIYDVKIERKDQQKVETVESIKDDVIKEPRKIRTESEILAYAIRNEPTAFCYTNDAYLGTKLISDLQKGYPKFKEKLRIIPDVEFEKRVSKDGKGKKGKGDKDKNKGKGKGKKKK